MSKKSKKGKRDKSERESKNKHKKKHNLKSKDSEKHKKSKKHNKEHKKDEEKKKQAAEGGSVGEEINIPLELMEKPKNDMTPMTKEQWEKQQSIVRRVYDETTGRQRLIKGDGEVIEEIVSRDRHKEINKKATQGDEQYFQSKVFSNLK